VPYNPSFDIFGRVGRKFEIDDALSILDQNNHHALSQAMQNRQGENDTSEKREPMNIPTELANKEWDQMTLLEQREYINRVTLHKTDAECSREELLKKKDLTTRLSLIQGRMSMMK
jgi:hypothetical protein